MFDPMLSSDAADEAEGQFTFRMDPVPQSLDDVVQGGVFVVHFKVIDLPRVKLRVPRRQAMPVLKNRNLSQFNCREHVFWIGGGRYQHPASKMTPAHVSDPQPTVQRNIKQIAFSN